MALQLHQCICLLSKMNESSNEISMCKILLSVYNLKEWKRIISKLPFKNTNISVSLNLLFLPSNYFAVDTASAIAIALMTFGTMYPMSVYSGKVLLQVRQPPKSTDSVVLVLLNGLIWKKQKTLEICFKLAHRKCSHGNLWCATKMLKVVQICITGS